MKAKELPEGWEWKRVGEIGKIFSGSTPSTSDPENFNGEIPWITPADLSNFDGIYIKRGKNNITEKGLKSSSVQILPKDTILFSSRAPIGYVAIAANPVTTNQGFKNLVLNEGIYPKYVFYYLKTHKREMQQYGSGTTFLEVSAERFSKIPIILPPLLAQCQIVAILEQAEALNRQRQQADELTQRFLQSVFYEMFGDLVRNEKGWEVKRLEDCMTAIIDYRGKTPKKSNFGIPLITAKLIKNGLILPPDEYIPEEDYEHWMRRGIPQIGDVLFTTEGPLGEVAILNTKDKIALAQRIIALRSDPHLLDFRYLQFLLCTSFVKNQLKQYITGSTVEGVRQSELRKIILSLPPLALQQQFAHIVEQVEALRERQRVSGKEFATLFDALMEKAFAGELVY